MSPRRVPPARRLSTPEPAASPAEAARRLKQAARELGFDPVGLAPTRLGPEEPARLASWLASGAQAAMDYLGGPERRWDAEDLLPGARAVLVVALPYAAELRPRPDPPLHDGRGYVARYAQGHYDYHRVLAARLKLLEAFLAALLPGASARRFCDTSPLLERGFARLAGLGFVGKNTCLIAPRAGSYLLLGGLVTDAPLPLDPPPDLAASCGSCTRCLEACPTRAFDAPFRLDARRCIAYWTIEHRGAWPEPLRAQVGSHVFGCDICQSVCPWNASFSPAADPELAPEPERELPDLLALHTRVRDGFKSLARETAWQHPGKRGFLRNLATAMGNDGRERYRPALEELAGDGFPEVREHARWALARLGGADPLVEGLRRAADRVREASPLSDYLLRRAAEEPALLALLARGAAPGPERLLAALQELAQAEPGGPLGRHYPAVQEPPDPGDPWPAVQALLQARPEALLSRLGPRPLLRLQPGRMVALAPALGWAQARQGGRLRALELGAGPGLAAAALRVGQRLGAARWGPGPVVLATRLRGAAPALPAFDALELELRDPERWRLPEDGPWLRAALWPEDRAARRLFERLLARATPGGPRPGPADAPLLGADPDAFDVALVGFSRPAPAGAERAALEAALAEASRPLLALDPASADELALSWRAPGAPPRLLARLDPGGRALEWLAR